MKTKMLFGVAITVLCLFLTNQTALAQTDDPPKFEVGAQFTSITLPSFDNGHTEPGFGGRFTYNISRSFAVETVGNLFPHKCQSCNTDNNGRITEGLFGVKAGKRFQRWGIFGKARPGVVSFSEGDFHIVPGSGSSTTFSTFTVERHRLTNFAVDVGGLIEFYPSRHIVTRFDGGDTIIRYGSRNANGLSFDPATGLYTSQPFTVPADTRHDFQFSAGVGYRF